MNRDQEGMARARALAQWQLGDPHWAHIILNAYFDPNDARAKEALSELEEQDDTP